MAVQHAAETARRRKKWMRRNDETALTIPQPRDVIERVRLLRLVIEIEQQDLPAANRPFDPGDQDYAALGRIGKRMTEIELPLVEGDRKGTVSELRGPIDELEAAVRDPVDGVVGGVGVKLHL